MGDQSYSTFSNILLENIESGDIPIAWNFSTPPKVTQGKENQTTNKLSTRQISSIISDTDRYSDENNKFKTRTVMRYTAPSFVIAMYLR